MCGIALCCTSHDVPSRVVEAVLSDIQLRGPDHFDTFSIDTVDNERKDGENMPPGSLVLMGGAVLHIQGDCLAKQPLADKSGGVLLWNGEIFGGVERKNPSDGEGRESDTFLVSEMLVGALAGVGTCGDVGQEALCRELATRAAECLAAIEGPFAFIYYHHDSQSVVYGRDPFGRRSLVGLRDRHSHRHVIISSTTGASGGASGGELLHLGLAWEELEVKGVYAQSLRVPQSDGGGTGVVLAPWPAARLRLGGQGRPKECSRREELCCQQLESAASEQFLSIFEAVLRNRIGLVHDVPGANRQNTTSTSSGTGDAYATGGADCGGADGCGSEECVRSPVGVLFSGGIDSVFLTAVLHRCLPSHYAIDLINVSFDGPSSETHEDVTQELAPSPDRLAAIAALGELQALFPTRVWRLVHVDVKPEEREKHEQRVIGLIQPQSTHMDLNIGTAFWFASRGQGYTREYSEEEIVAAYGVVQADGRPLLRSGGEGHARGRGEKPQKLQQHVSLPVSEAPGSECKILNHAGDEESGCGGKTNRQGCSHEGCGQVAKPGCPHAMCKRCCVKVFRVENAAHHAAMTDPGPALSQCPVHKKKTSAQSFSADSTHAAGAAGAAAVTPPPTFSVFSLTRDWSAPKVPYQCRCSILIVGIGADEQLAGYSRHRTMYQRGGREALQRELDMDISRIYTRNLGRDDRCMSDHGREAWFPFLDEKVVRFLQQLPLDMICDLTEPQGEGDKKILRTASRSLGLLSATTLVKRAIQFGTRVAKHTNVKYHGSNRSGKGTTQIV